MPRQAVLALLCALPGPLLAAEATLLQRSVLPADTFTSGPPTGQFEDRGTYGLRLEQPRFARQPVQGVSSIKPGPRRGTWWALSDNGFGTKWNSLDYRTCIYLFDERQKLLKRIELRDPDHRFPYRLILESDRSRPLTGGDIDPESLVVMADGGFWIGDEAGPWLLHFTADGRLAEAPVPARAPGVGELRSVNHPLVLAGAAAANVGASGGFEGLTTVGRGKAQRLYALLERPLLGDAAIDRLRLLEFDPARRTWTGRQWYYPLESDRHAIGELAVQADGAFLVIERDNQQGEAARTKKIFRVASAQDSATEQPLRKSLLVDLLALRDPQHVGGPEPLFRFSYWTIESVHEVRPGTLLVVNDNNYPASGGRGGTSPDPTEWLWIRVQ